MLNKLVKAFTDLFVSADEKAREHLAESLKEFEDTYGERGYEVLYVSQSGSKLYGTDNPNSDTDYKGLFVPPMREVLLKKDLDHWKRDTGDDKSKNGEEDVDLQLDSVYKFFKDVQVGETGALDLLFSMFREDTVEFANEAFVEMCKENYREYLNSNANKFVGYCVGQSKRYGVKGARFNELEQFYKYCENMPTVELDLDSKEVPVKLSGFFQDFELHFAEKGYKYVRMTEALGPKKNDLTQSMVPYVEVLSRKFAGDVTVEYFLTEVKKSFDQFGARARASAEGTDWKAMSHAVRVLLEAEELLTTGFVTFPLKEREYVKAVKENRLPLEDVMEFVDAKLDEVNAMTETTKLPKKSNVSLMEEQLVELVSGGLL